ncbi:hypothetical protein SAMN04487970_107912 [Paenibacillus tianmuensis]|uniref:Uncharacterized protein n=1 Tax=Paenibacillus tianmuensis TaxID=624147 RepID=A0A1G4TYM2_9BACL|nr:hypothetical protein SAMN04487970_107912 [Paenibacillus tianmuensis]
MSQHNLLLGYRKAKKDLISLYNNTVDKEDRSLISDILATANLLSRA